MPKKTSIRSKRFVLNTKKQLKGLWSAHKGQPLKLTYDYSKSASEDSVYKEFIEVAVENFNQLGLAHLKYQPIEMGTHLKICPLDVEYVKSKHKNPIIFSKFQALNSNNKPICVASNTLFYDSRFTAFFMDEMVGDNITLPFFGEISCNTAHKLFQRHGIGIILHEINHMFGIQHAHVLEETNGILTVNITKPALNDIKRGEIGKFFALYAYVNILQVANYTLISPFSIQHYRIAALQPYRAFNTSRISELLAVYQIQADIQADYFYLLEKYAGYPTLYTYQDIAALATAIYHIAPDSLMGRTFDFRKFYLIDGLYIPVTDKLKIEGLMDAFYYAEDFHYPILAQENITLEIQKASRFSINLYEKLKVIKLSKHYITCSLQEESTIFFSKDLLRSDCLFTGQIDSLGTFNFSILLSGRSVSIVRCITLIVKENNKVKNRVLLGRKQAIYYFDGDYYTDLLDVCQAVALPLGKYLSCQLVNNRLAETVRFDNCWFLLREESGNQNLSFIISNEEANKTCNIQFIFENALNLADENVLVNLSDAALGRFNEIGGYYSADNVTYVSQRENPFLLNQTRQSNSLQVFPSLTTQLNYCLTIPFLHGALDGVIDSYSCHSYVKAGLKLLPRMGLWYFDYLSPMSFALLGVASFIEGVIKNKLSNKVNESAEKFIHFLLFLWITELEYSFSNLWQLTGQLRFWSKLTDKFNQLFLQVLFAPLIKTLGYELSIYLIRCIVAATSPEQECVKVEAPLLINDDSTLKKSSAVRPMSFFSALCVASQSVFSSKTIQLFPFFSNTGRSPSNEVFRHEADPNGINSPALKLC